MIDGAYQKEQFGVGGLINIFAPYLNSTEHECECCRIEHYSQHS